MSDEIWQKYVSQVKASVWGDSSSEALDPYYDKYSPVTKDVIPDWSMVEWLTGITGGWKSGTRGCYAIMQSRKR